MGSAGSYTIFPIKLIEYGVYEGVTIVYPKHCSIYFSGAILLYRGDVSESIVRVNRIIVSSPREQAPAAPKPAPAQLPPMDEPKGRAWWEGGLP